MKKAIKNKYLFMYYYLDKCEDLQVGESYIIAKNEMEARNKLYVLARRKNITITNIFHYEYMYTIEVEQCKD